jgi:hypothetical protein
MFNTQYLKITYITKCTKQLNLSIYSGIQFFLLFQHHILPNSLSGGPLPEKRPKLLPLPHERVMIYVRQETEEAYTPLHLVTITFAQFFTA